MTALTIIETLQSLHGIPTETRDYRACLARMAPDAPPGYVIVNKSTEVIEYVARNYPEAVDVLHSSQMALDRTSAAYTTPPSTSDTVVPIH